MGVNSLTKWQLVRLCYPNSWRRYIGDLAPDEDKKFNWFLCSKRYIDPQSGYYVAEILKGTKFYEEATGDTLEMPVDPSAKLLIIDTKSNVLRANDIVEQYDYQGIAFLQECDIANQDEFFVCREAIFGFVKGFLVTSKGRAIIEYAKKNNTYLRSKIPNFPTSTEISRLVDEYSSSLVCKVLYEDMIKRVEN